MSASSALLCTRIITTRSYSPATAYTSDTPSIFMRTSITVRIMARSTLTNTIPVTICRVLLAC